MVSNREDVVSIIVPVYNTQKYIRKCLLSLINQTYKSIEILLINDASTDKSGVICDEFAKKDIRIKVIHEKKIGVSQARNVGILESVGNYICFVDSDDWLSVYAIEKMVRCMKIEKADFCYANYTLIEELQNKAEIIKSKNTFCETTNHSDFLPILKQMGFGPCWKLYDNSIIKNNQIVFQIDIPLGEDQIFNLHYLQYCHRIALEKDIVYFYNRLNIHSVTRNMHLDINKWLYELVKSYEELFEYDNREPIVQEFLLQRYVDFCYNACNHYVTFENVMGTSIVNQKIEETFSFFEEFLIEYEKAGIDYTYTQWEILHEYVKNRDLEGLKMKLKEKNYTIKLPIWKKKMLCFIVRWKTIFYYIITANQFDYHEKKRKVIKNKR